MLNLVMASPRNAGVSAGLIGGIARSSELFAKRFETGVNQDANVIDRQVHHIGDFLIAQAALELQADHLLLSLGQRLEYGEHAVGFMRVGSACRLSVPVGS